MFVVFFLTLFYLLSLFMSSLIDLAGDGISHLDLPGVESSSSQLLREGVLISDTKVIKLIKRFTVSDNQAIEFKNDDVTNTKFIKLWDLLRE